MTSAAPTAIRVEFESLEALERELAQNLRNGGAMVRGASAIEGELRAVVLVHPVDGRTLELPAKVVWVGEQDGAPSVGLAFERFGPEVRERILAFAAPEPDDEERVPQSVFSRLRGLAAAEQMKVAREGDLTERVALERIYGKNVWEALLRNPRLTPPEVARIAHMGTLSQPLVELIVSNASCLASPMVRRALLSNPRLKGDAIPKVLRAMPFGELKLVPKQTAYSAQIREAARKLLPQ
jgi:hypothetical protein